MGQGGEEGWKVSGGTGRGSVSTDRLERPAGGKGRGGLRRGRASVVRAVEPEWDKTRHGEEALVRIGGNRSLRSESSRYQRAGPI